MAKMKVHQLTDNMIDVADNGENLIATVTPLDVVRGKLRQHMVNLLETGAWSEQCFIRLANNDLIVGRFPQELTYESVSEIEQVTRDEHRCDPVKAAIQTAIELAETWISERETPPGSWVEERAAINVLRHKFNLREEKSNG